MAALFLVLSGLAAVPAVCLAEEVWKDPTMYGTFFVWYAPSFYTGTAPRSQDPDRVHIHLGRGNQLRVTVVMDEAILGHYLEDLVIRADMLSRLMDKGVIEPVQNMAWERFLERLQKAKVRERLAKKDSLSPEAFLQENLAAMRELEPGRVRRVTFDVEPLTRAWLEKFKAAGDVAALNEAGKLALVNELLPGRLWRTAMTPELLAKLAAVGAAGDDAAARAAVLELLKAAAGSLYPVRDGKIDVHEYTTIYPAGTVQRFINYKGRQIPDFHNTGVWSFIPRDHGQGILGMVDYISPNPGYGNITMLPYQNAGGGYYNAIHNDGMRVPVNKGFLPKEWKSVKTERAPHQQTQNLWINSRGPVSHGCTRIPSEHMGELRNMVPSDANVLKKLKHYRNLSHLYDVYDLDGDGTPEVMGVKYFLNYKVAEPREPTGIRAQNDRASFYKWLYGDEIELKSDGSAVFPEIRDARFVGREAVEGAVHRNIGLYEPEYPRDKLQFYVLKPTGYETARGVEFNRELRKVGYGHTPDLKALFLE